MLILWYTDARQYILHEGRFTAICICIHIHIHMYIYIYIYIYIHIYHHDVLSEIPGVWLFCICVADSIFLPCDWNFLGVGWKSSCSFYEMCSWEKGFSWYICVYESVTVRFVIHCDSNQRPCRHTRILMKKRIYVHIYPRSRLNACVCVCMYVCMYIYIYIYIYIYTYTYT
jgi:hypothetical protein